MNSLKLILYIYTFLSILIDQIVSDIPPKCCKGSEDFGVNKYNLGTSCSNKIICCPPGMYCYDNRKCVLNKYSRKKRKISRKKNYDKDDEVKEIKKKEIQPTKKFTGPVRIDWKTLTKCLTDSKSKEAIILDILNTYKKGKEGDAMKKVFAELKNNNPIIVDCLNNQEHLT